eukprot:CAMPEP_0204356232 /NCGR_PEP_ID=MMETSP0469-20131031/34791_1 /ASSEMBLY_ACC=CAM_ASM_000384 /TAXON_ID=2969 /ORGANISM="Oxyrrhis marina" /LENGTH=61 /DNA_ID=CAMNT_0051343661 /DNA_START=143 /DNA_END=325 /DNA_ORIENTATION=+
MNGNAVSAKLDALLRSVSMPIQTALTEITARVQYSKALLVAMNEAQPSSRKYPTGSLPNVE